MTRTKAITISKPFDAKHVGGVSIPGAAIPVVGSSNTFTTSLEPDEAPSHTFVAQGTTEVPRRSNSLVNSLSRPSLRLRTSLSVLRGRSSSHSPDGHHKREQSLETPDTAPPQPPANDMATHGSLRVKPSITRLRQRVGLEPRTAEHSASSQPPAHTAEKYLPAREPVPKSQPSLARKPSIISNFMFRPTSVSSHPEKKTITATTTTTTTTTSIPRKPSQPNQPLSQPRANTTRPKRADSGTAIDFTDVPADERPLGFKEIMAVPSFAERMALYKKTREYWATADHGLGEWVGRTGGAGRGGRRRGAVAATL